MSHQKKPLHKKHFSIINALLILMVSGGLIWAGVIYFKLDKAEYTNDAQIEEFITPINTRVAGYIKKIYFIEHQSVKKGDTLILIDDRELKIALAQAEAAYMNAQAARNVTSSGVNTVKNNVAVSESNIAATGARLLNAEKNYKRYAALLKDEVVTQQQYEQVQTEYDALKAQYQALKHQKGTTELSAVEAGSRIGVNEAELKRSKAVLDMAKLNLSYTVITAPYDGVVARRTLQEGQLIQAGQSLLSFVSGELKWVVANYREKQLNGIQVGQEVLVKVDALGSKIYKAKITAISQATGAKLSTVPVDNSTGNFVKVQQRIPIRIEFSVDNKPEDLKLLRAGMNVEVESI